MVKVLEGAFRNQGFGHPKQLVGHQTSRVLPTVEFVWSTWRPPGSAHVGPWVAGRGRRR